MDGYTRISHYKTHLMGIAVMIVVYGHLLYYHSGLQNYEDLNWTEWYTLGSVEMFIFLSGFGIYHSLKRNRDAGQFYVKRLSRLLPSYLPVMIVWCAWNLFKGRMRIGEAVGNLTAMGWWFQTGNQFNWYVPATLILYLISPLLFDAIERKKFGWAMAAMIVLNIAGWRSNLLMAVSRFPTYLLGMYFGCRFHQGLKPSKKEVVIWSVVGYAALAVVPYFFLVGKRYLWYYGMYWNEFFLSAPLWMFCLTKCLELQERFLPGRILNRVWEFLGVRSFEIYLCHLALYDTMLKHGVTGWPKWILIAIAGTCIGILFHEVVDRATKLWKARRKPAAA